MTIRAGLAAVLALASADLAAAQVPMSGSFRAEATCFATPSIRDAANPGGIAVEPGEVYELLGRNAVPGSHYLIRIPGAEPDRRWVAYGCGSTGEGTSVGDAEGASGLAPAARAEARGGDYVLAASWHAAFCETRPRAAECRGGGNDAAFALHGLWPQPRGNDYCGVPARIVAADEAGRWEELPPPRLSRRTQRDLERAMPGVAAGLDRHQWWKHGTCHGSEAEDYFAAAIRLLDELNASPVRGLFAASVGGTLTGAEIREAFDRAFGPGAGRRVSVDCVEDGGRRMIGELRIALAGDVEGAAFGRLVRAAAPGARGCGGGEVDAAGLR